MRKSLLIGGAIVAIGIVITVIVLSGVVEQEEDLVLSNYPKLFEKEVVLVIGENATQIEYESAEAIAANLENLTGNKPKIYISEKTESLKYTYNLIILGTPNSNEVLKKVCKMVNATMVTDEYPGVGKGILEILSNPWDEDKAMLLVEGSDEWGVKAGSEKLVEEGEKLQGKTIVTEKIETTLIELTGCVEPSPQYVLLPVTLPIDTKEEAIIIVEACGGNIAQEEPTKISENGYNWWISRSTYEFAEWGIKINKTTGKTDCIYFG